MERSVSLILGILGNLVHFKAFVYSAISACYY